MRAARRSSILSRTGFPHPEAHTDVLDLDHLRIREERPDDAEAIRAVNVAAFGQPAEADLVEELRRGGYVVVSLVAELHGEVIGHVLFSRMSIRTADGRVEALSLAPMAVRPEFQRQGIGSRLVTAGLTACRLRGGRIVIVLGHPEYYPRFGFSAERAKPITWSYAGEAWMALELLPGALDGVAGRAVYPPPFGAFD